LFLLYSVRDAKTSLPDVRGLPAVRSRRKNPEPYLVKDLI
jgi:hypothetical protein